ncbi:hypothetical protein PoB_005424500 [Plakobranchus ocellatus]|uniref:Uncharacterized protein n=1 Tax=Plakobranchus ocellatus TaxID=259542 RepID=A0AAV4C7T2_9GAST|nr:hypothetical protein PoB_005424500 [Plakobranchus ocellatus]
MSRRGEEVFYRGSLWGLLQPPNAKGRHAVCRNYKALSVASKRKEEDLLTMMSISPFVDWSPFKIFVMISLRGSAKVADRSPFKIHRELKSILGDETIEVTKLGSGGGLMVKLKSNDQAKKLGAISTFLDIPVTDSPHKRGT